MSAPTDESSVLMDLISSDNPQAGTLFCTKCFQHLSSPSSSRDRTTTKATTEKDTSESPPPALRCSCCQSVHYCSRTCQKANYPIHKSMCKEIHDRKLFSSISPSLLSPLEDDKNRRFVLASTFASLAYMSTDTIDRGRKIYHLALVEYLRLLRIDFHHPGVLQPTLLLLSILGYDDYLCGLIDFVFYRLEHHPQEEISVYHKNNGKDEDPRLVAWVQGIDTPDRKKLIFWLGGMLDLFEGQKWCAKQWCANNFLVPLLFWNMKQRNAAVQKSQKDNICVAELLDRHRTVAANLGVAIEERQMGGLPILWAMYPDSNQRWARDEAAELFALPSEYDEEDEECMHMNRPWGEVSILFWEILKDAIAFYPLIDSLDDTIRAMIDIRRIHPIAELSPTELAAERSLIELAAELSPTELAAYIKLLEERLEESD